jgi:hypothetical protein
MTENEKIITLNNIEYCIKTEDGRPLTSDIISDTVKQLMIKMNLSSEPNIVKLGTSTCPTSPIPLNTVGTLTASVTQGTAPYTYTWAITKPGGGVDTLPNSAGPHNYTFALTGTYSITLIITDNCPTGALSDSSSCSVTVAPTTGSITFTTPSTPGASIFLDGVLVGITPATITGVSLNIAHNYILRLTGYNDYTGSITLTTSNPNQTVTATLTQIPYVYSMSLSGCNSALSTDLNPSCLLTASCLDQFGAAISCGSITWSSSNTSIATVNSSGTVTAISQGTATITATTSNGKTATRQITVNPISSGSITFTTPSTPGASIFLDGVLVGITSATITGVSLNISHSYILRLSGYNDYTGSITLTTSSPNQTVSATLVLTCTPNWQCELPLNGYEWDGCNTLNRRLNSNCNPVSTGSIKFISDPPGATIILDSTNLGQITTYTKDNVSVGDHSYILRKDGYKEYLGTVTVTANQTVTVSVTLEIQITLDKITLSDILNNYTCYGFTTPKDTFDCNLETFKVYAIYSNGYCDVPPTVNQFIWYKWDTIGLKFIEYMRTSIFTIGTGYCTTEANLPCNSMYKVVYGTTEKIITIQQQTVQEFGMGMAAVVLGGLFILSKIISKK